VAVSEQDVRHVATLARLGLDDGRVQALVGELNGILAHMDVLQQVDLGGVSLDPDAAVGLRMREDVPAPIPFDRAREDFAPSMRDGFFLVPRLSTHSAQESAQDGSDGEGDE
jgi:aspartyl-tRNA(Asn)/glutamyl-tRNA(Gln) amidotransferase subunit C